MSSEYAQKLKDPRWQKKRLEILERDNWSCQICHDSDSTLVVHHRKYLPNIDPWDYPNDLLVTLCEGHHEAERTERPRFEEYLLDMLAKHYFVTDIAALIEGIKLLQQQGIFPSPELQRVWLGRYSIESSQKDNSAKR